jgi:hypothetical protein
VIILLTDSPPGGFDDLMLFPDDIDNAHLRATEAAAAGIKIAAIFTPQTQSQEVNAQEIMSSYATVTGGAYSKVQPFVAAPRSSATSPASWRSTGRRSRCARRLSTQCRARRTPTSTSAHANFRTLRHQGHPDTPADGSPAW